MLPSPGTLQVESVLTVFESSISTWENVTCPGTGGSPNLRIELLEERDQCTEALHYPNSPNTNSIMFVADGWIERGHSAQAFAVTLVWHDPGSGEIWDADMEINEARGPFTVCPAQGCEEDTVDLQNVVTHELGHYLGLAHTPDDPDATMWISAEAEETKKRDLASDDMEGLCAVYPASSLPDLCDPTPRNGLGLDCQPRVGCNCEVPGGRGGRTADGASLSALFFGLASLAAMRLRARGRRA